MTDTVAETALVKADFFGGYDRGTLRKLSPKVGRTRFSNSSPSSNLKSLVDVRELILIDPVSGLEVASDCGTRRGELGAESVRAERFDAREDEAYEPSAACEAFPNSEDGAEEVCTCDGGGGREESCVGVVEPEAEVLLGKSAHDALPLSDSSGPVVVAAAVGVTGGPSTTIGGGSSIDLIDPAESDDEESPAA